MPSESSVSLDTAATITVSVVAVIALAGLLVAWQLSREVLGASTGTTRMRQIASAIQEGAAAYLNRQFRTLAVFAAVMFFLLLLLPADGSAERLGRSAFFLVGAGFSGAAGYFGMWMAVRGNVRMAAAAQDAGEQRAMRLAFRTGGVAGMFTVGLGLFGAALVVLVYQGDAPKVLEGFGLGAALVAMFMRVGGGIFTKAADVGADLVGKVEAHIPEDDPRNAATIADNVGDNVGDCAGMAADLFESYAVTLVAALILGTAAFGSLGLTFPLVVPAIGVVTAVVGILAVTPRAGDRSGMSAINRGFFISALLSAVMVVVAVFVFLPDRLTRISGVRLEALGLDVVTAESFNPRFLAIGAVLIGIVLAAAIQQLTGYFTETGRRPVDDVSRSSLTGPATVILSGVALGFESSVYSGLLIGAAVFGAFSLGGGSIVLSLFAVALAGTGLLTTVGVIVSMDTFGPVSDNAQGIAEMSGDVDAEGAAVLTSLDAVGNSTKAITKGIAIATAVLAATALFGAFRESVTSAAVEAGTSAGDALSNLASLGQYLGVLDVAVPSNLVGLLVGAAVVFLFSGLAIKAVSRAAGAVINEVRRQFRDRPGIMAGTEKPEYAKVVDIVTRDSLQQLRTPGLLAVMTPIAVGFGLGVGALGAFLAGTIVTGTLMAVFLANSGGAWDNAKKFIEDGHFGGKSSGAHEATVIGDTVGDPFKDTAGPAINPLLKVMNLVSLLIAPAVVATWLGDETALRLAIAGLALLLILASLVASGRQRGVGEEVIDSIAGAIDAPPSAGTTAVEDADDAAPEPPGRGDDEPAGGAARTVPRGER